MSDPMWHHFVPQMYLRAFLDPEQVARRQKVLWVYEPGQKYPRPPKLKGTKAVAAISGFYHAPELGGEMEKTLSEIEVRGAAGRTRRSLQGARAAYP